jgi:hypothetical protein
MLFTVIYHSKSYIFNQELWLLSTGTYTREAKASFSVAVVIGPGLHEALSAESWLLQSWES